MGASHRVGSMSVDLQCQRSGCRNCDSVLADIALCSDGIGMQPTVEKESPAMNLMPWRRNAPSNFTTFQQEMNRMFEDFFAPGARFSEFPVVPVIDIKEDEESLTVTAELPGVEKEDVQIMVHDNVLTLKGEKRSEKREDRDNWHSVERSYGSFARRVSLPSDVDGDRAEATMDKGVLTLKLPKTKGTEKSIPVH
jgi:HSP20 family protein